jgi:indolepyruvate ferredoxin oxidoreductase beta subunit
MPKTTQQTMGAPLANILITGVGGQGTVLASKLLAAAALARGLFVRQAETIGMAQRGGSVLSHVRIAASPDLLHSPLVPQGAADVLIAFEPNEALRALPFLKDGGALVSATDQLLPVGAAPDLDPVDELRQLAGSARIGRLALADNQAVYKQLGSSKALNVTLLGMVCGLGVLPFEQKDCVDVIKTMVKPRFVDLNLHALELGSSLVD